MLAHVRGRFGHRRARGLDRELERRLAARPAELPQRFGIARERRKRAPAAHRRAVVRNAGRVERRVGFRRNARPRAPGDEDRLRGVARHGDDLAGNLPGKLALQRGVDHRHAIDVGIVHDDLERAIDEARVIEDRGGDVDRVHERAEARHELLQLGCRLARKRRHLHAAADALVGHEYPRAARDGDDGKPVAPGQPPAAESAPVVDDILDVIHLDDAGLPERGLVERHRAAEIRRMRGGGSLPLLRVADLPHEDGLARGHGPLSHLDQAARVLQSLDVAHDDFRLRIA